MDIYFDNIIFSLQKAGGISVVWYELIKRALEYPKLNAQFLDFSNKNIFREKLQICSANTSHNPLSIFPIYMQRYLNPNKLKGKGIFHSSYYRTVNSSDFINVTTVHDFTYEYFQEGIARFIHSTQKKNAIENSHCIICVSENTKRDLLKLYPDTDEKKIRVIYNGVNKIYHVLPEKSKNKICDVVPFLSNGYAIFIGDRKSKYKNFDLAVKACVITGTALVIIGKSINQQEKELINKAGELNFIQLSGISSIQLNLLYNNAICLIYPSSYEGFGIPIIEAQKAGCAVIASDNSSISEISGPISTLLNYPTVENISKILQRIKADTKFKNDQIEIGLTNAKRFSWDKCFQKTKLVYEELYKKYF